MVDIQSATAEIRRGKKKKDAKQDKNIVSASDMQSGHNKSSAVAEMGDCFATRDMGLGLPTPCLRP